MKVESLKRLLLLVVLCLAQALVFNRIHLFHCATPLVYVYFTLQLPRHTPRWQALLWSFFMGLSVDMFSNTPGMAAASMTLLGMVQPPLLELFLPRNAEENLPASAKALGWGKFASLALVLVTIYCVAYFSIEAFSFANHSYLLQSIAGSMVLTLLIIFTLETVRDFDEVRGEK